MPKFSSILSFYRPSQFAEMIASNWTSSHTSLGKSEPRPRVTGDDIPDEIWRTIAAYVSDDRGYRKFKSSSRLLAVNRTFFHVILSARYGEVHWINMDRDFLQRLERLQEPIIAAYVKKLHIRAWFIQFLRKRDSMISIPTKATNWIWSSLDNLFPRFSSQSQASVQHQLKVEELSSKNIVKSLIKAVSGMVNVTEFDFEWRDLPLNKDTKIFLVSTRTALYASLRKLVLRAEIPKFKELLAISSFDSIDELEFHFDYRAQGDGSNRKKNRQNISSDNDLFVSNTEDSEIYYLSQIVIPFINRHQARLHSLKISSSSHVDLALFFDALNIFPALRRFGVEISFSKRTLSSTSALIHFFQNHRSLRRVVLISSWQEQFTSGSNRRSKILQRKRIEWTLLNTDLLSHSSYLVGLESLQIPFLSLEATVPLLGRSSDTLTHLRLDDYRLSLDEVSAVMDIFSHRPFEMYHLHIEVDILDVFVITLLASTSPGLRSLIVVYGIMAPELVEPLKSHIELLSPSQRVTLADWRLSDLELYEERYQSPMNSSAVFYPREVMVMHHISEWVPSLRNFRGHPKIVYA